jgi:hypothetical protein
MFFHVNIMLDTHKSGAYDEPMNSPQTPKELEDELDSWGRGEPVGAIPIAKVRYSHDAMIDMVIAEPHVSQGEIAARFGYTQAWISVVFSSDAFKERLTARKEELVDPILRATIEERMKAMVVRSLEVLQEKLSRPSGAIPDNLALRALEFGAKGLGLGQAQPAPVHVHTDHLNVLAARLVSLRADAYQSPMPLPSTAFTTLEGVCNEIQVETNRQAEAS